MSAPRPSETRAALAFFAALALAVLAASPLHLPLNNPNEGVRVFAAAALVEEHTFAIDTVVRRWGYIDDKARFDGKLLSSKAPLPSMFAAAAYALVHPFTGDLPRPTLTRLCRLAGDTLPSLGLALVLLLLLQRRVSDPVVASLAVAALVLGTGTLASMQVLSGHALAALAVACGVLLATGPRDALARGAAVLLGACCSLAVGSEYPALLAAGILVLAFVWRAPRRLHAIGGIALGAAPLSLVVAACHTAMFGAPWRTGYSFLENKGYEALVTPGLFGIGAPRLDAFFTSFFSLEHGLFFFGPIAIIGGIALVSSRVPRPVRVIGVALVVFYALFIAGFRGWRGGWSVGPRYIAELWGFFAVAAALVVDAHLADVVRRARWVAALAAAGGAGLVTAGLAGAWFPHLPDTLTHPVAQLVLPLVARGFAPDSLALALGAPPAIAGFVLVVLLCAPFAVAVLSGGAAHRRPAILGFIAGCAVAVIGSLAVDSVSSGAEQDRAGAELRRMFDNFQPDAGNPILQRAPTDARTLVAVDRGRFAWPQLLAEGCAFEPAAGATADGPLVDVVARVPAGALLVVPDRNAPDIAGIARSSSALVVSATDLQRHARLGLPCTGEILWLERGAPVPQQLRSRERLRAEGDLVFFARTPRSPH